MSGPSVLCPRCGFRSHDPDDVAQGYCGHCLDWTSQPRHLPDLADPDRFAGHATIVVAPQTRPSSPPPPQVGEGGRPASPEAPQTCPPSSPSPTGDEGGQPSTTDHERRLT